MAETVLPPYQYVELTGVIVPDTSELLKNVQDEYKAAFGDDLNVDPNTPQGILIAAETLARSQVVRNNAAIANQINPNIAGGVFLDAILALSGATRNAKLYTTVSVILGGVSGTVIPAGSQARDQVHGEIFQSLDTVTLSGSPATATVEFRAVNAGPIDIAASTLTQVATGIIGWETITNPAPGVPGSLTQSDPSARALRKVTLANQGSSLALAITSALYEVVGVRSLTFRENVTDAPIVIDGVTLVAHSMYACVDGGLDLDVAMAILSKKSGGCNYNGNETVPVLEPASGQIFPVKFDRPNAVPILIRVTIRPNAEIQDPETVIKAAILAYAAGELSGEAGFIVGADISCFELSGAINIASPGIYVQNVETTISTIVPDFSNDEIVLSINQIATIEESSISVVIL